MDLLEYQAKDLFREMGIPVLPSQRIDRPRDLKGLKIPYPVVLKSQVYMGGRGRVGGVRFVENTIDAVAAAQTIFNLPICGEYPKVLLAEAKYNVEQELYLAVVLNRSIRRPVLLGSQRGGIDVQAAIDEMQHVIVDQEFSSFYARRLALKMGLQGPLIESASAIIEKMYRLFLQKDLELIEINPLGVSADGEVMALDGKVTVNGEALGRHRDLLQLAERQANPPEDPVTPVMLEADGTIAVLCNGAGLTMATIDLLHDAGGKPAYFFNLNRETRPDWSPELLIQRLQAALDLAGQNKQIRVMLVNLISGTVSCEALAEVIATYWRKKNQNVRPITTAPSGLVSRLGSPHLVVRLVGSHYGEAQEQLAGLPITLVSSLDDAIDRTVTLGRTSAKDG